MADKDALPPLDTLEKKLAAARHRHMEEPSQEGVSASPIRIGVELVSGVLTGMFIGYFLDKFLNTQPLCFLIGFVLGALGGGLNVYRLATENKNDTKKP